MYSFPTLFSGGTTGVPKGVLLTQTNACHYVLNCLKPTFQLTSKDRVFQGYSTAFDAGFGEVWMAFSAGATLISSTSEMMKSGSDLKDILRDLQISVLDTTPTNLLIMGDGKNLPHLRIVIVGGEQCSSLAVDKWQPDRQMFNMYGPTETTVSGKCRSCGPSKGYLLFLPSSSPNSSFFLLSCFLWYFILV